MAGTSKAARKNTVTSKTSKAVHATGEVKLLTPCNGGKNAYIRDTVTHANPNLSTGSAAFTAAVLANTAAGQGDKLRAEMAELHLTYPEHGWAATSARLVELGAFTTT